MNYNHFEVTFNSNTTMHKPTPQTNEVAKAPTTPHPPLIASNLKITYQNLINLAS
jgi:hypothetical protein